MRGVRSGSRASSQSREKKKWIHCKWSGHFNKLAVICLERLKSKMFSERLEKGLWKALREVSHFLLFWKSSILMSLLSDTLSNYSPFSHISVTFLHLETFQLSQQKHTHIAITLPWTGACEFDRCFRCTNSFLQSPTDTRKQGEKTHSNQEKVKIFARSEILMIHSV